jgi:hypothetical protein
MRIRHCLGVSRLFLFRLAAFGLLAQALVLPLTGCGGGDDDGVPVTMTLTATVMSASGVDVSWTPARTPPTRYELYANGVYLGPSNTTHWPVSGLAGGTRYCFVVFALYFPFGVLDRSNEACVTTMADLPPAAPTGVSATAGSPARIDLAWTAATDDWGIARYRIDRDSALLATVNGLGYTDTSVNPATTYCYTVTAIDSGGNASPPSAPSCATTPVDGVAPAAPSGLSATTDGVTVTLKWNASTDDGAVASYLLYRDGALAQTLQAPAGASTVTATDPMLAQFTQYCYQVIARDRAGNDSPMSNRACTTTSWKLVTVDAGAGVQWTSIAVDVSGSLHIGYYNGAFTGPNQQVGSVNYATNASGAWQTVTIDSVAPTVFASLSLLVNSDSSVHMGYYDFSTAFRLRHAMKASASGPWALETVVENALNVTTVSMARDSANNLHVVYNPNGNVTYTTNATGPWTAQVIGNNGVIFGGTTTCAIAIDTSGNAHVGFYDFSVRGLKYATNASGSWVTQTVDIQADVGVDTAIAVDAAGKVHLSYYDVSNTDLKYATNAAGSWVAQTLDSAGDVGRSGAIALDAAGNVHISYTDATDHALKYATNASGSWITYGIDSSVFVAGYTSIAVDSGGKAHISYRGDSRLRYATNR